MTISERWTTRAFSDPFSFSQDSSVRSIRVSSLTRGQSVGSLRSGIVVSFLQVYDSTLCVFASPLTISVSHCRPMRMVLKSISAAYLLLNSKPKAQLRHSGGFLFPNVLLQRSSLLSRCHLQGFVRSVGNATLFGARTRLLFTGFTCWHGCHCRSNPQSNWVGLRHAHTIHIVPQAVCSLRNGLTVILPVLTPACRAKPRSTTNDEPL
jgi:hypothetical protein